MTKDEFALTLNSWGKQRRPFLFLVDFELERPIAIPLDVVDPDQILFSINGFSNAPKGNRLQPHIDATSIVPFNEYRQRFNKVYRHLSYGDTYLANLTVKTEISLNLSVRDVFYAAVAPYKLCYGNDFVVFSPECFVRMENNKIRSFPMKGTIDAAVPNAAEVILRDVKELAEHVTIVDLIRNDLSLVASNVNVTRFRYVDEIRTRGKNLLQVSSEITGDLGSSFRESLGDILLALLPAGSVSGAPKEKTVQIIREAENEKRGYYTGVFGYFDGDRLDSGVMIRYIEQTSDGLFYRSGGGITTQSVAEKEYQEIIDKVYVPVA